MIIPIDSPFDLENTLRSGQVFRWHWKEGCASGVVFGNIVKMRQTSSGVEFQSSPDEESKIKSLLEDYLGLGADLESIYKSIGTYKRINTAIERYRGMRILRQEPWECLVSFMCSTASNIPRISKNVEAICTGFGQPLRLEGQTRFSFPTPDELAGASGAQLTSLGLGFRARRVADAALAVARGQIDLMALREASYDEALRELTTLDGVGDKVANCAMLFSLDKLEAFPVDVWIDRDLREWCLEGLHRRLSRVKMREWAQKFFGPYAGYANHYMFHDRRLRNKPQL